MTSFTADGFAAGLNTRILGMGENSTTLVLAHGYGSNQCIWDKVTPDLSKRYRVVTFDWSFTSNVDGNSSAAAFDPNRHISYEAFADDLVALADELNIRDAVYLGHSMSGMIGCMASVKRPEIFRHLVLIGASPRYLNSEEFEWGFEREDIENIFSNIEFNFHQWSENFPSLVVHPDHSDESTEKFRRMLQSMRAEVALSLAKTAFLSDHRKILEEVELPCTIVQCSGDIVVPTAVAEYMKKQLRGEASVEIVEAYGHFPQLTVPTKLIEIVDRVLGRADHDQPAAAADRKVLGVEAAPAEILLEVEPASHGILMKD